MFCLLSPDPLKVKFHAHLNSMEESMNATKREKVDVESLTRQLETGRTKATLELQASELNEVTPRLVPSSAQNGYHNLQKLQCVSHVVRRRCAASLQNNEQCTKFNVVL